MKLKITKMQLVDAIEGRPRLYLIYDDGVKDFPDEVWIDSSDVFFAEAGCFHKWDYEEEINPIDTVTNRKCLHCGLTQTCKGWE